jgi:hypothetical protein
VTYDELERVLAEVEKIVRVKGAAAPRREERGVPIDDEGAVLKGGTDRLPQTRRRVRRNAPVCESISKRAMQAHARERSTKL